MNLSATTVIPEIRSSVEPPRKYPFVSLSDSPAISLRDVERVAVPTEEVTSFEKVSFSVSPTTVSGDVVAPPEK